MKKTTLSFFFLLLYWCVFEPNLNAQNSITDTNVIPLPDLLIQYRADYGSLNRFYTISNSPEKRERFKTFAQSYLDQLATYDYDALVVGQQVDYQVFKSILNDQLYRLEEEKQAFEAMQQWTDLGNALYDLEKQRRRGKQLDGAAVAKELNDIATNVIRKSDALKKAPDFSRDLIRSVQTTLEGQREALQSVVDFYKGYDPLFSWWVVKPAEKLDSTLGGYADLFSRKIDASTLPKDDGSGIIGSPIGRTELIRLLEQEMIPYSPEELVKIANKEFAWCDKELLKASQEMGFGNDWQAAQEKVKQAFVPPGKQPEAMLDLYNQSVDFLKANDLLTIPPLAEETWRMAMIPPERQLISPFFLGGELLQISYPTDDMEHGAKMMSMRGNNPHFSRSTVHHELIAGHHLQQFMNSRNNTYRFYRTPFWTEGWALYWEILLWDLDFPRSAEDRIGMLFWRMHRCARIIFSLNYHLERWTPQECIDFLVDRVGHERANAEGEVRRSFTANYPPLYQLAYMTGGMQFYALKKELVDSGQMTYKQFHDAVMRENSMPVEMLRAILREEKLPKNFKTNWRFYDL